MDEKCICHKCESKPKCWKDTDYIETKKELEAERAKNTQTVYEIERRTNNVIKNLYDEIESLKSSLAQERERNRLSSILEEWKCSECGVWDGCKLVQMEGMKKPVMCVRYDAGTKEWKRIERLSSPPTEEKKELTETQKEIVKKVREVNGWKCKHYRTDGTCGGEYKGLNCAVTKTTTCHHYENMSGEEKPPRMICPRINCMGHDTCKHIIEHEKNNTCDDPVCSCPPCVEVEKKEVK